MAAIISCHVRAVLARASGDTPWDYGRHYRAVVAAYRDASALRPHARTRPPVIGDRQQTTPVTCSTMSRASPWFGFKPPGASSGVTRRRFGDGRGNQDDDACDEDAACNGECRCSCSCGFDDIAGGERKHDNAGNASDDHHLDADDSVRCASERVPRFRWRRFRPV